MRREPSAPGLFRACLRLAPLEQRAEPDQAGPGWHGRDSVHHGPEADEGQHSLWPLVWVVDQGWWGSEGRLTGRETPVRRGWREVGHLGKRADRCRGAGHGDKWGVGPW